MKVRIRQGAMLLITWLIVFPASADDLVPFRAVIHTAPVPVGPCGPGCLALEITGGGRASLMGATALAGPSQVDLILGTQTGSSTLTAANGDTLEISFSGTVEFEGETVHFQGEWVVIAGTGRFEEAEGSGTYSGSATGPAGTLLLDGDVTSPRADR